MTHDAWRQSSAFAHYVLDFESRFREAVIDDFADSYLRGETPVPCIRCNQTVKFADLMARAKELGAAALLTGHYVESRARGGRVRPSRPAERRRIRARDQSYFLFATTQAQIDFLRFPLASLTKPETRQIAAELGLGVAEKPDSQDICFVPNGRYADVIARLRPGGYAKRARSFMWMEGGLATMPASSISQSGSAAAWAWPKEPLFM